MPKRYIKMSLPIEFHDNLKNKQNKINEDLRNWGIKKSIPLTRIMVRLSEMPLPFADDMEVINFAKRNGRRQKI